MFYCIVLFAMVLIFNATAIAQATATPTPAVSTGPRQANPPSVIADNAGFERLRSIEMLTPKNRAGNHPLLDPKKGIYRRPSKEETEALAVAGPLLERYAAFLKGPDTGIVKLSADSSCVSDTDTVAASEKCLPFRMPGAGIAYSFRTESYRLPRLADLILHEGIFKTGGAFQQVVMAEIGDLAIEEVTLDTRGMKYLVDFETASDTDRFTLTENEIVKGIEADGFLYRKGHSVKENSTYALRSIAYRGKYIRSIDGIPYDEMDFDKRRDVIVAFRVVDRDSAGNVTIVWKRLKDVESPKLKVKK